MTLQEFLTTPFFRYLLESTILLILAFMLSRRFHAQRRLFWIALLIVSLGLLAGIVGSALHIAG